MAAMVVGPKCSRLGHADIACLGFGDQNVGRQVVVVIQQHMRLHASFGLAKLGPVEQVQAQRDGGVEKITVNSRQNADKYSHTLARVGLRKTLARMVLRLAEMIRQYDRLQFLALATCQAGCRLATDISPRFALVFRESYPAGLRSSTKGIHKAS